MEELRHVTIAPTNNPTAARQLASPVPRGALQLILSIERQGNIYAR
jgi:hypothetical protein